MCPSRQALRIGVGVPNVLQVGSQATKWRTKMSRSKTPVIVMRLAIGMILAISLLASTVASAFAHDMAVTLANGTCVLVPHAAGNPGPAVPASGVSTGLSRANPKTDAIVSVVHGGSCP